MADLNFCCKCNDYLFPEAGTIRSAPDGIEIICPDCLAIEQGRAEAQPHDINSGTLEDVQNGRK